MAPQSNVLQADALGILPSTFVVLMTILAILGIIANVAMAWPADPNRHITASAGILDPRTGASVRRATAPDNERPPSGKHCLAGTGEGLALGR